jgi:hypothetical protein
MSKIVDIARNEIGTVEFPANSNKTKYGQWFGFDGVAWCGMFVSWCYYYAGQPLPNIGFKKGFAGCQTAYGYFKKNNLITNSPQSGDIVLFDWNSDRRFDHTGIFVEWVSETKFKTIEGNTSLNNDSNGGIVMERVRDKSVATFIHIK